ncbi:hypothetical protein IKK_04604 [Bacillus mycoides]|uniref:Uncharacterized protein n=1 Tax=Bacillus mycoides TaxID=1405 RepID=A0AAP8GZ50_BACMY|nr:hypothetical protein BG05_1204 [Bacillus mycoides]ETT70165.1 hypothetical protein C174_28986 [Bacillus mycoides FSL H7-687]RBP20443.1 hypothetical protein DET63_11778 [Bacillus sp. DB-2]EOO36043.1 hypothetical protein IKK_04604 [Bacillus mycoides]PJN60121.1 hypothetical protein BAWEI_44960 [Bacillus mycoides]
MKNLIFDENVVQKVHSKKVNVVHHTVEKRGHRVCY